MDLPILIIFLVYFLVIFGAAILFAYFVVALRRNLKSARAIWIAICLAHLIAILAFDYYHPSIAGSADEPRFAEQYQWLSIFPTLLYCFPSSVFSFGLAAALSHLLCSVVGEHACDSQLAFLFIWWLIPVTLGYLQWFMVFPPLLKKFEKRLSGMVVF